MIDKDEIKKKFLQSNKAHLDKISIPTNDNPLLIKTLEIINSNEEVKTIWRVMNVNAIDRLGMTDHGPKHLQIVSNNSLAIMRILHKHDIQMSIEKNFGLGYEYAELIVFLASLFHDVGMSINRAGHEEFSLFLSNTILREILTFLPIKERVIVTSEVLHAIINHRSDGKPLTIEGGIVRVADALDMSEGRSRMPFEQGKLDIHSVSAFAIDKVEILEGTERHMSIKISMNNSAGLFQVDELLKSKLRNSGIEQFFSVKAYIDRPNEKNLIKEFTL